MPASQPELGFGSIGVLAAAAVALLGLVTVALGQATRALLEQANATRELVALERAKSRSRASQVSLGLIWLGPIWPGLIRLERNGMGPIGDRSGLNSPEPSLRLDWPAPRAPSSNARGWQPRVPVAAGRAVWPAVLFQ